MKTDKLSIVYLFGEMGEWGNRGLDLGANNP